VRNTGEKSPTRPHTLRKKQSRKTPLDEPASD
jgi:hypothetical protein